MCFQSIRTRGSVSAVNKPRDTQVRYLREPPFTPFQPIVVQKTLGLFLRNSYNYVVQLIYTTSQTKFERNSPRSWLVTHT